MTNADLEKLYTIQSTGLYNIDKLLSGGLNAGKIHLFWSEDSDSLLSPLMLSIATVGLATGRDVIVLTNERLFKSNVEEALITPSPEEGRNRFELIGVKYFNELLDVVMALDLAPGSMLFLDRIPRLPEHKLQQEEDFDLNPSWAPRTGLEETQCAEIGIDYKQELMSRLHKIAEEKGCFVVISIDQSDRQIRGSNPVQLRPDKLPFLIALSDFVIEVAPKITEEDFDPFTHIHFHLTKGGLADALITYVAYMRKTSQFAG